MEKGIIDTHENITDAQLELINRHTRQPLSGEDVFCFNVVLCDNDIDRDFECFTEESLQKLGELFIGKTGIFDHSQKGRDQCARIFDCVTERISGQKTADGRDYIRLKASAYMPKTDENRSLITEINAGIKKEVSVGCRCEEKVCSICGKPAGACAHRKGIFYKSRGVKKLCYFELKNPSDAYEWSFVAVPAQPKAGVVKSFAGGKEEAMKPEEIIKSFENAEEVKLGRMQLDAVCKYISNLENIAKSAKNYLDEQKRLLIARCVSDTNPTLATLISAALDRMNGDELFKMFRTIETNADEYRPQIGAKKSAAAKKASDEKNRAFSL